MDFSGYEDFDADEFILAFKADRTPRQEDAIRRLGSVVEAWLADFGNAEKRSAFEAEVMSIWLQTFQEQTRRSGYRERMRAFRQMFRDSLDKTTPPENPPQTAQIERIATWAAVMAINSGTAAGFAATGVQRVRWLTMHDSEVRETHREADGSTAKIGGTFDIGGYDLHYPGEPVGPPEIWINCRCVIAPAGRKAGNVSAAEAIVAAAIDAEDPEQVIPDDVNLDDEELVDDMPDEIPVHGVATIQGKPTGDGRMFKEGSLSNRELPLPLRYEFVGTHGGQTSDVAVVGRIDEMWLEGDEYRYRGVIFPYKQYGPEAIEGIVDGSLTGVSVEVDSVELDQEHEDAKQANMEAAMAGDGELDHQLQGLSVFSNARICGFTIVPIPAYAEAYIGLGEAFEDELSDEDRAALAACGCDSVAESEEDSNGAAVATFAPGTHDGPGWITHPRATARIRRYWVSGKGAAKIRWGVPGDFNRCRKQLAKYVQNPNWLAGLCANMHKEAIKLWPGQEDGGRKGHRHSLQASGASAAPLFTLTAAAHRPWAPESFFQNPGLTEPTPLHVDLETGRVYGHAAAWGVCHIGIPGACTTAPKSATNYAYFLTGAFHGDNSDIAVGQITMDTGHAPLNASSSAAAAHYDNTGRVVADVTVGEDQYGIWVAGALRPDVDEDTARRLAASKLSGDWRNIRGNLELVGLLAVNVPGFPIPRTSLRASAGEQQALILASGVEPQAEQTLEDFATKVADVIESRTQRKERLAAAKREALKLRLESLRANAKE